MDTKDIIAFSGIGVSLAIGIIGLVISYKNSKRTIFINSITSSRIKWIEVVRNYLSQFISNTTLIINGNLDNGERKKIEKDIQITGDNIKLQLNRQSELDLQVINLIEEIQSKLKIILTGVSELNQELILKSQDLLKFEWERIKEEAKSGDLSDNHKKKLVERVEKSIIK